MQDDIVFKGEKLYVNGNAHNADITGGTTYERSNLVIKSDNASFNWDTKLADFRQHPVIYTCIVSGHTHPVNVQCTACRSESVDIAFIVFENITVVFTSVIVYIALLCGTSENVCGHEIAVGTPRKSRNWFAVSNTTTESIT